MGKGGTPPTKSAFGRSKASQKTRLSHFAAKPAFQFMAFGAFVLAIVLIMTVGQGPATGLQDYAEGEVAPHDIKASRDFVFMERDVSGSEQEREAAARAVPAVYDWQQGLGEAIRVRIGDAFSASRAALATAVRATLAEKDPRRLAALEESTPPGQLEAALVDLVRPEERVVLARTNRAEVFDAKLGVVLRDSDFDAFARSAFSESTENALAGLVSEVMGNIIVPSKHGIEAEGARGVFLRRLGGDKVLLEYHLNDVEGRVVPIERASVLVDEASARRLASIGDREIRSAVTSTATALVQPNTTFNPRVTEEKREAARRSVAEKTLRESFRKGQVIVDKGHLVSDRDTQIILQMRAESEYLSQPQLFAGVVVLSLLLLVTFFLFGRRNIRKFRPTHKDIAFIAVSLLVLLAMTRLGLAFSLAVVEHWDPVTTDAWRWAVPVAACGMLIRLVLNSEHAILVSLVFAFLAGLMAEASLYFMIYAAIGGLVGANSVKQVTNRIGLMLSGVTVGGVNVLTTIGFLLFEGSLLQLDALGHLALAFVGGVLSGFLVSALLPLFESVFSYTTDIKLLELSNLNHPALRELIMRAPGSYHHSMMVGSLCEAAAEAIGCNPLLARVGSYYHDIGKAKNPQYFAENQKLGENPHDKLKPNISALVIKAHVKDGVEMAKQYRLPVVIQDFITQHHGTSLIRYFYHKAKQLEDPDIPEVDESDYRYPGPKPQSRETAICLLADGIEAASRAMPDPTPARLKGLVQKMINLAFTDGQLDDCDLTLKDLNMIADAFHRILTGIYHHRPEYPSGKPADRGPQPEPSTEAKRKGRNQGDRNRAPIHTPTTTEMDVPPSGEVVLAAEEEWDITADQVQDIEDGLNAGRHLRSRNGKEAPGDRAATDADSEEDRQSLPRLGSH